MQLIDSGKPIDRKVLESFRGSLVYLQRTYPAITPYIKGYHLTIDGWRPDRDSEGWRCPQKVTLSGQSVWESPPAKVKPVPRFREDVLALIHLFSSEQPPVRYVRSKQIRVASYSFTDTSGGGFSQSMVIQGKLHFAHGTWTEEGEQASSNYRELENLVMSLEHGLSSGLLLDSKVWIFTDNSTSEFVFWKGHSSSPLLSQLALRLRQLEMSGRMRVQMVHVPGTRMIAQGTDGLSRGNLTEGVMAGRDMLQYVPLHLTALDRQPSILDWLKEWKPGGSVTVLNTDQWFDQGHGVSSGTLGFHRVWLPAESEDDWFVWHPAPSLGDIAMDELAESRHKRPNLSHIVLLPRLMTFAWRRRLTKTCDLVFEIPPGCCPFWPDCEHEPLIVGLTLRFSAVRAWQARFHAGILELERELWRV